MDLYHFTCAHRAPMIREDGYVRPGNELSKSFQVPWACFAWYTDMAVPARGALGLTNYFSRCDRTAYRFTVTGNLAPIKPWLKVRHHHDWALSVEATPGARPAHWYVCAFPIQVTWE